MGKKISVLGFAAIFSLAIISPFTAFAADKLKFATSVKLSANYFLPMLAAEEGGFWKQNGLEVEWVAFESGRAHIAAVAAGAVTIGFATTMSEMQAAAAGLPTHVISALQPKDDFTVWVRTESRFREPKDLKGARIGVSGYGGIEHAYSRMIARALGVEKDVRIVSTGGISSSLAALKAGNIDGVNLPSTTPIINLKVSGDVREFLQIENYRPKEWITFVITARKDFSKKSPDLVKRAVKSVLQATDFITKNPRWAIEKMKSKDLVGYPEEAAKLVYNSITWSKDGRITRTALENVRNFLIEYGIITKEKAPSLEEFFTDEFLS